MKDKILEIIENNTWIRPQDGEQNMDKAADEICQMMADEMAIIIDNNLGRFEVGFLLNKSGFTPEQIDNALNKLK